MSKRTKLALGLGLLAAVVGVVAWLAQRGTPVELVSVDTREIAEIYVATGRVRSPTVAGVGSELAGRVAAVHVVEGASPASGAPLVDLQPLDAELGVRRAEANVELAESELARVRQGPTSAQLARATAEISAAAAELKQAQREAARASALTREGVGTPAELDRARTAVNRAESRLAAARANLRELREPARAADIEAARARIDEAEANLAQTKVALGKTTITAPFEGLVLSVDAAPGENVAPGQPLVTMARTDALEVFAEVDEDYFARIEPGQTATLVFAALPDQRFAAQVMRVGPEVDADRGVVGVHLQPERLPTFVVPGLTVDVAVELKKLEGRAVPRTALIREGSDTYVFVIRDGEASREDVEVLAEGEDFLAVEGLRAAAVIERATEVRDGERVREREGR